MDVVKNLLPVFQAILTDFKHVFSTYAQQGWKLTKHYSERYFKFLLGIYEELEEAVNDDKVPLFFIAAVILILILGTNLFFFALFW